MHIFGIVGWKNSGKTTLIERLIAKLTQRGYRVASVKHAHHDVDLDQPGRDSYRHRQAGAIETLLATKQRWALMHEYGSSPETSLEQLVTSLSPCDIVIVEGYKQGAHPKIEVVRQSNEKGLLVDKVPNITAVASDIAHLETTVPVLDINDLDKICDWLLEQTGLITKSMDTGQNSNDCFADKHMLQPAQAVWDAMKKAAQPSDVTTLPLDACHNHHLASDILSKYDSPRFDNVAVDGWAIAYKDLSPANFCLPIMDGHASAGSDNQIELKPRHCLRVSTGARMPTGADTIVMQEDTHYQQGHYQDYQGTGTHHDYQRTGTHDYQGTGTHHYNQGAVTFPMNTQEGSNWRQQGEDVTRGQCILPQGQLLRPQDIGIAAATGHDRLPVHGHITVALFSTGNEVHEVGQALPSNGIYDVNRHMLKALYQDLHCQITDLGILADDYDTIYKALTKASESHHLIVTSGGASTGDHDHIAKVLEKIGEVQAWRIAIKPGRPLAFGKIGKALFLGLPGNPVAASVCSLMFGGPLVRALSGSSWHRPIPFKQKLGFDISKRIGRREWIRVYRDQQDNGEIVLRRSAAHGSGILTSMTRADGLVELDEQESFVAAGSDVEFLPFSGLGLGLLD